MAEEPRKTEVRSIKEQANDIPAEDRPIDALIESVLEDPDGSEAHRLSQEELRRCIKSIESRREYREYKSHPRTFGVIESLLNDFDEQAEEASGKEIAEARVELKRLVSHVIRLAQEYTASLLSLEHIKVQQYHLHRDRYVRYIEARVRSHSKIHDALIEAARKLNEHAQSLRRFGIVLPKEKLFTWEETDIKSRDVIGAWAFYIERGSRMEEVLDILRKKSEIKK